MNQEEGIRIIAYHIWEEEGCNCHGNDVEHWLKAETIWQEKNKPLKIEAEIIPSVLNQQINAAGKTQTGRGVSTSKTKKTNSQKGSLSICPTRRRTFQEQLC